MERIAVFPGSFDPFTVGHEYIVRTGLRLFDKIVIAIGYNSDKSSGFFPLETRKNYIEQTFAGNDNISVMTYKSLTVDFCQSINARFILRGLRTSADFEYEKSIAQVNKLLNKEIESIFILTEPELSSITSTLVRDIIRHGGDARRFMPNGILIEME